MEPTDQTVVDPVKRVAQLLPARPGTWFAEVSETAHGHYVDGKEWQTTSVESYKIDVWPVDCWALVETTGPDGECLQQEIAPVCMATHLGTQYSDGLAEVLVASLNDPIYSGDETTRHRMHYVVVYASHEVDARHEARDKHLPSGPLPK